MRTIAKKPKGHKFYKMRYTFIMNYDGGTFIAQIEAKNEHNAMRVWLRELDVNNIEGFTEKERQRLIDEDFEDEDPIPIEGCTNIWCFGLRVSNYKELALINFVKTCK